MTYEEAGKCISLLEKAFGWKVRFYASIFRGVREWQCDVEFAGNLFGYDSPTVDFYSRRGDAVATGNAFRRSATKNGCMEVFAEEASGAVAGAYWGNRRLAAWAVPEFDSAAELELKLAVSGCHSRAGGKA